MRTSHRDKRPVAYASYVGQTEMVDENGDYTGESDVQYSTPVKTLMNVSGGRGQADVALFGLTQNFSRTAVTQDLDTDWNTEMVMWVERDPDTEPFDYRISQVARTFGELWLSATILNSQTARTTTRTEQ